VSDGVGRRIEFLVSLTSADGGSGPERWRDLRAKNQLKDMSPLKSLAQFDRFDRL